MSSEDDDYYEYFDDIKSISIILVSGGGDDLEYFDVAQGLDPAILVNSEDFYDEDFADDHEDFDDTRELW